MVATCQEMVREKKFFKVREKSGNFRNLWLWQPRITRQCAVCNLYFISVWSTCRARHCGIAVVWAKMSPSNTCSGSFWLTSNCVSKEKETRKWNFSLCKTFLNQYFGLNFRRLKVKQEPKSREYDVRKKAQFSEVPAPGTSLNKWYEGWGRLGRSTCLIESPSLDVRECKVMSNKEGFQHFWGKNAKKKLQKCPW